MISRCFDGLNFRTTEDVESSSDRVHHHVCDILLLGLAASLGGVIWAVYGGLERWWIVSAPTCEGGHNSDFVSVLGMMS